MFIGASNPRISAQIIIKLHLLPSLSSVPGKRVCRKCLSASAGRLTETLRGLTTTAPNFLPTRLCQSPSHSRNQAPAVSTAAAAPAAGTGTVVLLEQDAHLLTSI